jgi:hypothetical protein
VRCRQQQSAAGKRAGFQQVPTRLIRFGSAAGRRKVVIFVGFLVHFVSPPDEN